ncbi:MAG: response regulator [Agriterribacter sp.]
MKTTHPTNALKKVLIVEDEGEICLLLNLMLANDDVAIDHVQTLFGASEYILREKPSVVLLDNRLPDGYGIDFIDYLKENSPGTKVIMISGVDGALKDLALDSGADIFLQKPFTKAHLTESVNVLLN